MNELSFRLEKSAKHLQSYMPSTIHAYAYVRVFAYIDLAAAMGEMRLLMRTKFHVENEYICLSTDLCKSAKIFNRFYICIAKGSKYKLWYLDFYG